MSTVRIYKGRSMGNTFQFGDRLRIEPAALSDIRPGEVVVYHRPGPAGDLQEVVHRVSRVLGEGLETRGDRNPCPDPAPVAGEALVGRVAAFERGGVWSAVPDREPARGGGVLRRIFRRLLPREARALSRKLFGRLRRSAQARLLRRPATRRGRFMTAGGPTFKRIRGRYTSGNCRKAPFGLLLILLLLPGLSLPARGSERPPVAGSLEGVVGSDVGKLRAKPSLDALVVARLQRGDRVALLGRNGPWFVVRQPDDRLAWGHEVIFQKTPGMESLSGRAGGRPSEIRIPVGFVREKPSTAAQPLSRIREGARVSLFATFGEWRVIELPDRTLGWVHESLFHEPGSVRKEPPMQASPVKEPPVKEPPVKEPPVKAPPEQEARVDQAPWNVLKEIRFEVVSGLEERVLFYTSLNQPPRVLSTRKGSPVIICEFLGARTGEEIGAAIGVDGRIVGQIRISQSEGLLPNVQVVLDLIPVPGMSFQVQPVLVEKENLFTIVVRRIQRP